MKNRIGIIVLVVICVGLLIAVVMVSDKASKQSAADSDRILNFSNRWVTTTDQLERQKEVNAQFEKDIDTQRRAFAELTNSFTQVSANLAETSTNLAKTEESLTNSLQEIAKREAKIAELESQNQALDKQATDLSTAITNLTVQISDTQKKLAASEGDKAFLEKELKRLMTEKAELERQFNDLTVLRAQVAKLKEELNIARRIEWIRQGLFASSEQKGAQKLMQGFGAPQQLQAKATKPTYDLNVEITSDGSVRVVPPLASTNSPPAK